MQSRRTTNKIKCREAILKASRRLFKDKGYENTMIEDVAEKAQVSKATLYNYFPNKASLLTGTLEDEMKAFDRYIEAEVKSLARGDEKVRKALTFLILDSILFIDVSRRILFLNGCRDSHMWGKANQMRDRFLPMVEEAQKQEIFRGEIPGEEIVEILMGIYLNVHFQWQNVEQMSEEECRHKVAHMLDLALAGVYCPGKEPEELSRK